MYYNVVRQKLLYSRNAKKQMVMATITLRKFKLGYFVMAPPIDYGGAIVVLTRNNEMKFQPLNTLPNRLVGVAIHNPKH